MYTYTAEEYQSLQIINETLQEDNRVLENEKKLMLEMLEWINENFGHIDTSDFGFPTLKNYIEETLVENNKRKYI